MKVQARISFVGSVSGQKFRAQEGDEFELPDGVDWLNAGLVQPVKQTIETAVVEPPEHGTLVDLVGAPAAAALREAGIETREEAHEAMKAGKDLTEIDGVGPATVKKLS